MINITNPSGMSLNDWAGQVMLDLDKYGALSRLEGDDWQEWAIRLLNSLAINRNFPLPYDFDEWRDWAERFAQALS